jgi:hypothetical protein
VGTICEEKGTRMRQRREAAALRGVFAVAAIMLVTDRPFTKYDYF